MKFFHAFETQVEPADHQQRQVRPGGETADEQGQRDEDELVDRRALGDGPDDGKFSLGDHAADLPGVQGQIVAEHAGGFGRGLFRQDRDVVEDRSDVIKQGEETTGYQSG